MYRTSAALDKKEHTGMYIYRCNTKLSIAFTKKKCAAKKFQEFSSQHKKKLSTSVEQK